MKKKNTITVYWSPSPFLLEQESYLMLYSNPKKVINTNNKSKNLSKNSFFSCPATKDLFKNIYCFNNELNNIIELPEDIDEGVVLNWLDVKSPVDVFHPRISSLQNYCNLQYNMGWLMFADEPLVARFTSPYFPATTPAEGAILSAGEFDIGSWYRPFLLDYHIPYSTKTLCFKKDDPLFYVEFKTNKKIEFKRYNLSAKLNNIASELSNSSQGYGKFNSFIERYSMFKNSSIQKIILSEIKNNLIETDR